jgi:hypothetical protein
VHGVWRGLARGLQRAVLLIDKVRSHHASTAGCLSSASFSGSVAVIDSQSQAPVFLTRDAHAAEAWCCTWLDHDLFATGADDCQLKLWDRRCPEAAVSSVRPHDAGVTYLGPAPVAGGDCLGGGVFASGSYDGFVGCRRRRVWLRNAVVIRSVKLWDLRAIPSGSSKGGRGCLSTLQIEGGGVWGIDWRRRADGGWLGAVAGMCERASLALPFELKVLRFARYSGVHMIHLAPASCGGMLQLLHSSQAIHGDGALVRDLLSSHDRNQASPRFQPSSCGNRCMAAAGCPASVTQTRLWCRAHFTTNRFECRGGHSWAIVAAQHRA